MPQTERERSLVEHLATKVCGWKLCARLSARKAEWARRNTKVWRDAEGHLHGDIDLDSWADAGMCLDIVMEQDVFTESFHLRHGSHKKYEAGFCSMPERYVESDSGPRAICEAIGKATGWKEPA